MKIKITISNYSDHFLNSLPKGLKIQEEVINGTLPNSRWSEFLRYNGLNLTATMLYRSSLKKIRRPNSVPHGFSKPLLLSWRRNLHGALSFSSSFFSDFGLIFWPQPSLFYSLIGQLINQTSCRFLFPSCIGLKFNPWVLTAQQFLLLNKEMRSRWASLGRIRLDPNNLPLQLKEGGLITCGLSSDIHASQLPTCPLLLFFTIFPFFRFYI